MILVTGGAGFLGRHLCRRLDQDVVVVDNLCTSKSGAAEQLRQSDRVHLIEGDVADPATADAVTEALAGQELEQVYHLASPASPPEYHRMPIETMRTCAEGTRNMLELTLRHDAAFLMASTSEIYGDPEVHPQSERYRGSVNVRGPRAVYDEGKRYAEAITYAFHREHGLGIRVARIFNTYGPGMREEDGRVVSTFMHRALAGLPLPVQGDGSQTRSFCYVDDMVEGLMRLMARGSADPVNLGNPEEVRVLDLARMVHEVCGEDTGLEHLPLPKDDPARRRPDISKAQRILDWRPTVGLHDGLRRYHAALVPEVMA